MANNSTSSGGIGFLGALTILFIGLKLIGAIQWSWLWVLSPIWLSMAVLLTGIGLFAGFFALIGRKKPSKKITHTN